MFPIHQAVVGAGSPVSARLRAHIAKGQLHITNEGAAVTLIEPGSLVFVTRGMILADSFPVGISRVPVTINQDMKALTLKRREMAEYLLRALKGLKREMLDRVRRSSHGTCRIEGSDYSDFDFLVPISPPAEHRRQDRCAYGVV